MKIALNCCYGGFSLSEKACEKLNCHPYAYSDTHDRNDPRLIQVIEELGRKASGSSANLRIYEIPEEATDWMIYDYDGVETLIYVENGLIFYGDEVE